MCERLGKDTPMELQDRCHGLMVGLAVGNLVNDNYFFR